MLQTLFEPWLLLLADDPLMRSFQLGLLLAALVLIFLVFFTTRDILHRSHSFWFMLFSIVLVAFLPFVGFLLYLLVRPSRTLLECEVEDMIRDLHEKHIGPPEPARKQSKSKKSKSVGNDVANEDESA